MSRNLLLLLTLFTIEVEATTITELFDAIREQPSTKVDELSTKMGELGVEKVNSNYYPKIDMFGTYTHYNSPTNLMPLDPLEAGRLSKSGKSLPFANTIEKIGIIGNIPIYVKELGDLSNKAKHLTKSAKLKKRLNILKNEAIILGSDASLEYIEKLLTAMQKTKSSLTTTRNIIKVGVDSGRMAGIALDKLDQKLNELDISINNIEIKKAKVISQIESLTNIELSYSAPLNIKQEVQKGDIFALKPLQELILASEDNLKATKAKRYYPKVGFNLMWSENYALNNVAKDKAIREGYGYYQIGVSMPLYDKQSDSDIEIQKVKILKDKMKLAKTEQELKAQAKELTKELELLNQSQQLTQQNIAKQEKLLAYAKVAFEQGSMTQEDYLRYEDALLSAKAKEYQVTSQKWQTIGKLAVIYGNDLEEILE